MPFRVMSGVGRVRGVLDGVVIVEGQGAVLGVNLGRPTGTSRDFVEYLCMSNALFSSYFEDLLLLLLYVCMCD